MRFYRFMRRIACLADKTDALALPDFFCGNYVPIGQMAIDRLAAIRMIYHYVFSVTRRNIPCESNTRFIRIYRGSDGCFNIYACMRAAVSSLSPELAAST